MSFSVVIPSAKASNLIPCVQALLAREQTLPPSSVIVVDDGARADSEVVLPPVTWVAGVKPYVCARNVNIGIVAAGTADVLLLNDDALLETPDGFTLLADQMRYSPTVGVCSAGIRGVVCNPDQVVRELFGYWETHRYLAFMCVYIPRAVIDRVGLLDERFDGYGYDDFDYCRRVVDAGYRLAVWDGCVVDHTGDTLASTFRTRPDLPALLARGRQLYEEKWAGR